MGECVRTSAGTARAEPYRSGTASRSPPFRNRPARYAGRNYAPRAAPFKRAPGSLLPRRFRAESDERPVPSGSMDAAEQSTPSNNRAARCQPSGLSYQLGKSGRGARRRAPPRDAALQPGQSRSVRATLISGPMLMPTSSLPKSAHTATIVQARLEVECCRGAEYDLTGILDRASCEATAWPLPRVAGRPDPGS